MTPEQHDRCVRRIEAIRRHASEMSRNFHGSSPLRAKYEAEERGISDALAILREYAC